MQLYTPITDHLKLDMRMNLKTKKVEIKTTAATQNGDVLQKAADFVHAFLLGFEVGGGRRGWREGVKAACVAVGFEVGGWGEGGVVQLHRRLGWRPPRPEGRSVAAGGSCGPAGRSLLPGKSRALRQAAGVPPHPIPDSTRPRRVGRPPLPAGARRGRAAAAGRPLRGVLRGQGREDAAGGAPQPLHRAARGQGAGRARGGGGRGRWVAPEGSPKRRGRGR